MSAALVVHLGSPHGAAQLLRVALAVVAPALRRAGTGLLPARGSEDGEAALVRAVTGAPPRALLAVAGAVPARPDAAVAAIEQIRANPRWVDVVLHAERPDRVAEHRLVDALRHGTAPAAGPLDHAPVTEALRAHPAVRRVTVRPYELVGAGVPAWVDDAVGRHGRWGSVPLPVLRRTAGLPPWRLPDPDGVALVRALAPELRTDDDRRRVLGFATDQAPADARPLDAATRHALVREHADASARFLAAECPDVPPGSWGDDAATALLGSVLVPLPPPGTVERVRTGVRRRAARAGRRVLPGS